MVRYLLDSDVLIWVLRNRKETVRLVDRLVEESGETVACSALSLLEVWAGSKPSEVSRTAAFFDTLEIIPVSGEIAKRADELLKAHHRAHDPREWIDALIAATALEQRLTLITYNQRDYPYHDLTLYPLTES